MTARARPTAPAVAAAWLWLGGSLSGCALPIEAEMDHASGLARYATRYDHVVDPGTTFLDRALAGCGEKTVKAETACVREAVDALPSVAALAAATPGCRVGQVCRHDHTTRDRLGFVEASATDYVRRWRVDLDLRRPAVATAQVPVTVTDRDDFDSAPAVAH